MIGGDRRVGRPAPGGSLRARYRTALHSSWVPVLPAAVVAVRHRPSRSGNRVSRQGNSMAVSSGVAGPGAPMSGAGAVSRGRAAGATTGVHVAQSSSASAVKGSPPLPGRRKTSRLGPARAVRMGGSAGTPGHTSSASACGGKCTMTRASAASSVRSRRDRSDEISRLTSSNSSRSRSAGRSRVRLTPPAMDAPVRRKRLLAGEAPDLRKQAIERRAEPTSFSAAGPGRHSATGCRLPVCCPRWTREVSAKGSAAR